MYFTQVEAFIFSLKQTNKLQQIVENSVKIIQYLMFFSDMMYLLFFLF